MGTVRTLGYAVVVAAGAYLLGSILFAGLAGVGAALVGVPMAAGAGLLRATPLIGLALAVLAFLWVVSS